MINIFDVDYTVLKHPTAWYFLCEAIAEKVVGITRLRRLPLEWLRYKLGFANNSFIEETVKHLAGIEKTILEKIAETSFNLRMKRDIFSGAAELIRELQVKGEPVIFATSSISVLTSPLERFLGITESIANKLEFAEGKTTGRISGSSSFGEGKRNAVQTWLAERQISPQDTCFYSDSYTDLPLLEYCGHAIAVNPDRILAKEAKKRGWKIIHFRQTLA
ncbi:MAG TPA: hypothetical protein DEQ14_04745 [Treponema sp.]|nr:hypothetical protein [Treponema sp.]